MAWTAPLLALLLLAQPASSWAAAAAADRPVAAPPVSLSEFKTVVAGSDREVVRGYYCPWSDCRGCDQYRKFCGGAESDASARAARPPAVMAAYGYTASAGRVSGAGVDSAREGTIETPSATSATFVVSKFFLDGNDGEVEVSLSCATGLPLEQTATVSAGHDVAFVVTEFADGGLNCTVSEAGVPGYSADYHSAGSDSARVDDAGGCHFTGVQPGDTNLCQVSNSPGPVAVEITQLWVTEGAASEIDTRYAIHLVCGSRIVGGYECNGAADWCIDFNGSGEALFVAEVIPDFPTSTCSVSASAYSSAVETGNGCGTFVVGAGEDYSCTIVNTVFFESIPVMSRTGLAILALLMLGFGVAAYRRGVSPKRIHVESI